MHENISQEVFAHWVILNLNPPPIPRWCLQEFFSFSQQVLFTQLLPRHSSTITIHHPTVTSPSPHWWMVALVALLALTPKLQFWGSLQSASGLKDPRNGNVGAVWTLKSVTRNFRLPLFGTRRLGLSQVSSPTCASFCTSVLNLQKQSTFERHAFTERQASSKFGNPWPSTAILCSAERKRFRRALKQQMGLICKSQNVTQVYTFFNLSKYTKTRICKCHRPDNINLTFLASWSFVIFGHEKLLLVAPDIGIEWSQTKSGPTYDIDLQILSRWS